MFLRVFTTARNVAGGNNTDTPEMVESTEVGDEQSVPQPYRLFVSGPVAFSCVCGSHECVL